MENWKALQVALGLVPEEMPIPVRPEPANEPPSPPRAAPTPPRPKAEFSEIPAHDSDSEIRQASSFEEPSQPHDPASSDDATQGTAGDDQEVEVGEAPEEVPEEPSEEQGAPGDKRRRRRRRRRRRGGGEGSGEDSARGEEQSETAEGDDRSPTSADDAGDDGQDDGDDDIVEEDEEEIEPLSITDWNVPTWQELIASLYRPER